MILLKTNSWGKFAALKNHDIVCKEINKYLIL